MIYILDNNEQYSAHEVSFIEVDESWPNFEAMAEAGGYSVLAVSDSVQWRSASPPGAPPDILRSLFTAEAVAAVASPAEATLLLDAWKGRDPLDPPSLVFDGSIGEALARRNGPFEAKAAEGHALGATNDR